MKRDNVVGGTWVGLFGLSAGRLLSKVRVQGLEGCWMQATECGGLTQRPASSRPVNQLEHRGLANRTTTWPHTHTQEKERRR